MIPSTEVSVLGIFEDFSFKSLRVGGMYKNSHGYLVVENNLLVFIVRILTNFMVLERISVYAFGLSNYRILSHSSHFGRVFCLFSITQVQFSEKRISTCLISFQATARCALFLILPDYCLHRKAAQTIQISNEMLPRIG